MALPEPEPGLVISYSYLWRRERAAGEREGRKNRPCAIVLVIDARGGAKTVTVAPITHSRPPDLTVAIEIPPAIKRHLRLDAEPSWIVLDDFNQFGWPGFDLRSISGDAKRFDFGMLPPAFFMKIVRQILELRSEGRIFLSSRDEV